MYIYTACIDALLIMTTYYTGVNSLRSSGGELLAVTKSRLKTKGDVLLPSGHLGFKEMRLPEPVIAFKSPLLFFNL